MPCWKDIESMDRLLKDDFITVLRECLGDEPDSLDTLQGLADRLVETQRLYDKQLKYGLLAEQVVYFITVLLEHFDVTPKSK